MRIRFWAIRLVLGVTLGFGAAFVVEVIHLLLVVVVFGSLDNYLNRKHPREEAWLHFLCLSAMIGGALATAVASLVAVLIAPAHFTDRAVLRSWLMASTLGALAGSGLGGSTSLLHPRFASVEFAMTVILAGSILAGMASAVLLRVRVNR